MFKELYGYWLIWRVMKLRRSLQKAASNITHDMGAEKFSKAGEKLQVFYREHPEFMNRYK